MLERDHFRPKAPRAAEFCFAIAASPGGTMLQAVAFAFNRSYPHRQRDTTCPSWAGCVAATAKVSPMMMDASLGRPSAIATISARC
jgi:hypothetical protein